MEESLKTGQLRRITTADLLYALTEVKPSTRAWFETARNYALFANASGQYDQLLEYMRARRLL